MRRVALVLFAICLCLGYSGAARTADCAAGDKDAAALAIGVPPWLSGAA